MCQVKATDSHLVRASPVRSVDVMRSLLLMFAVATGLVSASPRCDGLLSSGQCHQIYSPVCGVGQRLFSGGPSGVQCDCDVTKVQLYSVSLS